MTYSDQKKWYVVANKAHAGFYDDFGGKKFNPILHFFDEKARLSEGELDADGPGSETSSEGIHTTYDSRFNSREQVNLKFARRIATYLELMRQEGHYNALVLVAEPGFMGYLKKAMSAQTLELVVEELPKEFRTQSDSDLRERILHGLQTQRQKKDKSYEYRSSV